MALTRLLAWFCQPHHWHQYVQSAAMPVGVLLTKLKHEVACCLGLFGVAGTSLVAYSAHSVVVLYVARFVQGVFMNIWDLSRKTLLATEVPERIRGAITSTIAGCNKIGIVIAVLLSGIVA